MIYQGSDGQMDKVSELKINMFKLIYQGNIVPRGEENRTTSTKVQV